LSKELLDFKNKIKGAEAKIDTNLEEARR